MAEEKDDLELKELGQYYGTTQYHNVLGKNVTDGIVYIMHNGYSWFVTDMLAVLIYHDKFKGYEDFLSVKLKLEGTKGTAVIEDGNGSVLYTQEYKYTDAKREVTLFYEGGVLLLSGEH